MLLRFSESRELREMKRNEEVMTRLSKDSELGGSPRYRSVTALIKEQEEEERTTAIQTDKDMSWHSRPPRSANSYESRASPELKEEEERAAIFQS